VYDSKLNLISELLPTNDAKSGYPNYELNKMRIDNDVLYYLDYHNSTFYVVDLKSNVGSYQNYKFVGDNMQSLDKIICVCKDCHACIHMGHTLIEGDSEKARQHYMRVNNLSLEECENDIEDAFELWETMSQVDWFIDETKLIKQVEETYNISCDLSKPIDNKYYANIPYKLKEKAKSFGAKWDNKRKLWYFTSEIDREKWYEQYE
jgi:hypothetical protein